MKKQALDSGRHGAARRPSESPRFKSQTPDKAPAQTWFVCDATTVAGGGFWPLVAAALFVLFVAPFVLFGIGSTEIP
jgi:hypothetical protein